MMEENKREEIDLLLKKANIETKEYKVEDLIREASTRKYSRLHLLNKNGTSSKKSLIFCDGLPQPYDDNDHFIELSNFFKKTSISTPDILAMNREKGQLLLSDVGKKDLCSYVSFLRENENKGIEKGAKKKIEIILFEAIDLLLYIQSLQAPDFVEKRVFDFKKLYSEMEFLLDSLHSAYKKYEIEIVISFEVQNFMKELCSYLGMQENFVLTHRDFHSRNIMLSNFYDGDRQKKIGSQFPLSILDYQDARKGLYVYDLVSLLYDPYLYLPSHLREVCLDYFIAQSGKKLDPILYYGQALQRLLKALGNYIDQSVDKRKKGYIVSVLRSINMANEVIAYGFFPDCVFLFLADVKQKLYPLIQGDK